MGGHTKAFQTWGEADQGWHRLRSTLLIRPAALPEVRGAPPAPQGSTFSGCSRPHPGPGSITPRKGRACASRERRKHRRKPEGGARLCPRGSPSRDTPGLAEARDYRNICPTHKPRAGAIGTAGRRSRRQQWPRRGSPARQTGSREGRQPRRPQASARPGELRRPGGPGAKRAG